MVVARRGGEAGGRFFSVVMYGCKNWTIDKAEPELMLLNCGVGRRLFILASRIPHSDAEGLTLKIS